MVEEDVEVTEEEDSFILQIVVVEQYIIHGGVEDLEVEVADMEEEEEMLI